MRCALTIAGSDSIGGAGIQADIKAMTALGVHAETVITAITAQNTCKVTEIMAVPGDMVQAQLDAVLSDSDIKAIKTGMLYNAEIVGIVADALTDHDVPLIIDPVMTATVGDPLSEAGFPKALKEELLPMCELVTPNKTEAEILSGMKIRNEDDAMFACELIGKQGSSVLLKGGHMDTKNITDFLYLSSEFTKIKNRRLNKAGHGSGCTLSAYITANMAKGLDVVNAVLKSRDLMQEAIAKQYPVGEGGPVVCPLMVKTGNSDKFKVLEAVDAAADRLVDVLPHELVPETGINIAFAMPRCSGPEDIAAVDKRLVLHNGMLVKNGPAKFGAAEHLSYMLMEIMRTSPETRCVMYIKSSVDMVDIMEEVGMTLFRTGKKGNKSIAELTREAIAKRVPDAIVDLSTESKSGGLIRILGKDPEDVLNKLESVF